MKSVFKPLLVAALLAGAGFAAYSQAPMGGAGGMSAMHEGMNHEHMGKMEPGKMQAWMDKRNAALKAKLKLTTAQEGGWTTYTAAMKVPTDMMASKQTEHAELAKLPTPERIDKMKDMRTKHMADMNAEMDKRGEATKTFYATLSPEQQKVFDANAMHHNDHEGRMHGARTGKTPMPAKP